MNDELVGIVQSESVESVAMADCGWKGWNGGTDGNVESVESVAVVQSVNVVNAKIDENVEMEYVDLFAVSVLIHVDTMMNVIGDYVDCGTSGCVDDSQSIGAVSWTADCRHHSLSYHITASAATWCVGARYEVQR